MVLNVNSPYTVHLRSIDRYTGTPSEYNCRLKPAISCKVDEYITCQLTSAQVPNSFYTINSRNNKLTVEINTASSTANVGVSVQNSFPHISTALANWDTDGAGEGPSATLSTSTSIDFELTPGNYSASELGVELVKQLDAALLGKEIVTFLRTGNNANFLHDLAILQSGADNYATSKAETNQVATVGGVGIGLNGYYTAGGVSFIVSGKTAATSARFTSRFLETTNKLQIMRTDIGGCLPLGQFVITAKGNRLYSALGFPHITAQDRKDLGDVRDNGSLISSHNSLTSATNLGGFDIVAPLVTGADGKTANVAQTRNGHFVSSQDCCNIHANDSVYIRCSNLGMNSFESLYGGTTNLMAIVPMTGGDSTVSYFSPTNPNISNVGSKANISQVDVRLTDGDGNTIDFNGVENELSITFQCFKQGTTPQGIDFSSNDERHRRHGGTVTHQRTYAPPGRAPHSHPSGPKIPTPKPAQTTRLSNTRSFSH